MIQLYTINEELYEKLLDNYINTIIGNLNPEDQKKVNEEKVADDLAAELSAQDLSAGIAE